MQEFLDGFTDLGPVKYTGKKKHFSNSRLHLPFQRRVLAVDDQLGLSFLASASRRHRTRGGRTVAHKTAHARLLANGRRGGPAVSHQRLRGQSQLQVTLRWPWWRFFVHRQDIGQHAYSGNETH